MQFLVEGLSLWVKRFPNQLLHSDEHPLKQDE